MTVFFQVVFFFSPNFFLNPPHRINFLSLFCFVVPRESTAVLLLVVSAKYKSVRVNRDSGFHFLHLLLRNVAMGEQIDSAPSLPPPPREKQKVKLKVKKATFTFFGWSKVFSSLRQ